MLTNCSSGGRCLPVDYIDKVGELAKKHGLKLHIDGARIFHASVVSENLSMHLIVLVYSYHTTYMMCKLLYELDIQ